MTTGADAGSAYRQITAALRRNLENLAETLLGPPRRRTRQQLIYPGGLVIELADRGRKRRGQWYSFTESIGGTEPKLIAHCRGLDRRGALGWASQWAGIALDERKPWSPAERRAWRERQKRESEQRQAKFAEAKAKEDAKAIAKARRLWSEHSPIGGTLGNERYLIERRGLPEPAAGWPSSIGWHAPSRSLIAAATDAAGDVQAVHRIFLDAEGGNRVEADDRGKIRKLKLTHGRRVEPFAAVRLPALHDGLGGTLQRAEGVETGLSAWAATGNETWCLLGPLSQSAPPRGRLVIDCRDDDPVGSPAELAYEKALATWRQAGLDVHPITPWPERRGDKSDFNDLLRAEGLDAVRRRMRAAELAGDGLALAEAPFPLPSASSGQVRGQLVTAIRSFFARRLNWQDDGVAPPRMLAGGATGIGKSEALGRILPPMIELDRDAHRRPHRVIVLVPAHRLGVQLAERYQEMVDAAGCTGKVTVEVFRGRGNPSKPTPDDPCQNPKEVELALAAGADVTHTVCGGTEGEDLLGEQPARCALRDDCEYLRQFPRCAAADILIVAHNFVFQPLPKALLRNVSTVIVEEDFTAHGLGSVELPIDTFDGESLADYPVLAKGKPDYPATDRLRQLFPKLHRAIAALAEGKPAAEAIREAELTAEEIAKARKLNWRRKVEPEMRPGMPLDERKAQAEACSQNAKLIDVHAALRVLQEIAELSESNPSSELPGITAPASCETEGERIWAESGFLQVPGLKKPAAWIAERPVIIASATARPDLIERFFPGLEIVQPPAPAMPHQRIIQHLGAFGQSALERQPHKVAALRDFGRLQSLGRRNGLVVVHKKFEPAFQGLPGGSTLHFGSVEGDDDFGDVEFQFVIGGAFAKPKDIARLASAETGRRVAIAKPAPSPCVGLLDDGQGVAFERMAYADPVAQAVHAGIYDSSIIQAIGRGRGINRSAKHPLDVHIFANVPLPFPVAKIQRWRPPNPFERMLLTGRVVYNAADIGWRHPSLFRSRSKSPTPAAIAAAAAQAIHRLGGIAAVRADMLRLARRAVERDFHRVTWQPAGQGHKPRLDLVARAELAAFRAETEQHFGELVLWRAVPLTTVEESDNGNFIQKEPLSDSFRPEPAPIVPPAVERPPSHAPP